MKRIRSLEDKEVETAPEVVTSGDISADFIVRHLSGSPLGTVAVINYLQILDQQRSKPSLSEQVQVLHEFVHETGVVLGFISQIDRSFDPERNPLPGLGDVRLPGLRTRCGSQNVMAVVMHIAEKNVCAHRS